MIEVPLNTLQREQHPLSVCKVEKRRKGKTFRKSSACNRFLITLFRHLSCAIEIGFFYAQFRFDEDDSCVVFVCNKIHGLLIEDKFFLLIEEEVCKVHRGLKNNNKRTLNSVILTHTSSMSLPLFVSERFSVVLNCHRWKQIAKWKAAC